MVFLTTRSNSTTSRYRNKFFITTIKTKIGQLSLHQFLFVMWVRRV